MRIGLYYGSTTCYTEMAAEKIQSCLNELFAEPCVTLYNIKDHGFADLSKHDVLIFGISTWDFGELQEDWEAQWQDVAQLPLQGKPLALFGLGDQQGYGEWFVDALGMLHDAVAASQPIRLGLWPNQGYEFVASKGLCPQTNQFFGLALDEESQYEQSEQRIEQWCNQLLEELAERL